MNNDGSESEYFTVVSNLNVITSVAVQFQQTVLNLQGLEIKPQSFATLGNLIFFFSYSTKAIGNEMSIAPRSCSFPKIIILKATT